MTYSPVDVIVKRSLKEKVLATEQVLVDEPLLVSHSNAMADTQGGQKTHHLKQSITIVHEDNIMIQREQNIIKTVLMDLED